MTAGFDPARRKVLQQGAGIAGLAACLPLVARAADARPVRLVLPLPPGGAMDLLGRGLAQEMAARLGRPFVVDNRPGAGGNIATEFVAGEKPDGTTLLLTSEQLVTNTTLFAGKVHYDPQRSFTPIALVATAPFAIVVHADSPVPDLAALVALAGRRRVTIGTPGYGNAGHLALTKLQARTHGELQHIPYKGAPPAVMGLLGGEIDAAIVLLPGIVAQLQSGKLRALAVVQEQRSAVIPDVPTVAEAGSPIPLEVGWHGLLGPAGLPAALGAQLQAAAVEAVAAPALRNTLLQHGFQPTGSTSVAFAAQLRDDVERYPALLKGIGAAVD